MLSWSKSSDRFPWVTVPFSLMLSLPFLVPFHTLPIPSFQSEWLAMFFGLSGLIAVVLRGKLTGFDVPSIAMAPVALSLVVLLQFASGMIPYFANAFIISMYLLWSALLAIGGRTLKTAFGEERLTACFSWALLAGGVVNAIFGLMQYVEVWQIFGGMIVEPMPVSLAGVYGNVAQQNHFSTHIALAIVSACYLCLSRQLTRRWYWACVLILFVALVLSGSRTGFLHLAWIILVSSRALRFNVDASKYKAVIWWVSGGLLALIVSAWIAGVFVPLIPQVERLLTLSSAIGPRLYLWKHAFFMFLQKPLLGVGFGSFAYELTGQLQELKESKTWGIDQYAHNLVLQLLSVSGIVGFVAVAWPASQFVRRLMKLPFTLERMWGTGVLGMLAIHSMLEQPLFYTYFLGIAALVAGAFDPFARSVGLRIQAKMPIAILLGCALLFLFKTANDYDRVEGYFYSGRYFDESRWGQRDPRGEMLVDLHAHSVFGPLTELLAPALFINPKASPTQKIEFNDRIRRFAPVPETEFRHSALLAEAGLLPDAMRQLNRATYAYPKEIAEYVGRFNALAAQDAATYGALAEYANDVAKNGGRPDR